MGVSAKRYCLFDESIQELFTPSSLWSWLSLCTKTVQGVGQRKQIAPGWIREAWEFIIADDPHAKVPPWFSSPAMMRIGMTTPKVQLWRAISEQQQKVPQRLRFKPFNFVVSPIIARCGIEKKSGRHSQKRSGRKGDADCAILCGSKELVCASIHKCIRRYAEIELVRSSTARKLPKPCHSRWGISFVCTPLIRNRKVSLLTVALARA